MRLSTMWRLDRVVAPDGTSPLATALAAPWRPDAPPKFVRSSANAVFAFERDGRPAYLRFTAEADGRSRATVVAELAAMAAARRAGIRTPEPVAAADGNAVRRLVVDDEAFVVVVLSALEGEELEADEIEAEQAHAWGALAARLQEAMRAVPTSVAAVRGGWLEERTWLEHRLAQAPDVVRGELLELGRVLDSWADEPAALGLVHLDVEADNLRWVDDDPGVLDFDDCSRHWYAVDVASALRDLDELPVLREAFLDDYEAAGGAPVRERLTDARRWLDLVTYARIERSLDLEPEPDNPAWLLQLRDRLVDRQRAYVEALGPGRRSRKTARSSIGRYPARLDVVEK